MRIVPWGWRCGPTTAARHRDDYLESWLELWDGKPKESAARLRLDLRDGDGTCNVGLGILNTSAAFGNCDYRELLQRWLDNTPEDWGFREENRTAAVRGAALPMGFNRQPHYGRGLVLVGDAGGMVNPFNGEGIAYAIESGELAAIAIAEAHGRGVGTPMPSALSPTPASSRLTSAVITRWGERS